MMADNGGASTAQATKSKRPKIDRTPLEHAQRRVKEQIQALGANNSLDPAARERLQDYLTGVERLLSNAPFVPQQFASEPFATIIALGRAARSAGGIFAKPAAAK